MEKNQSNFAPAFDLLPPDKARALNAVYTFSRIIDDCVDSNVSTEAKQNALDFWKTQLTKTARDEIPNPIMQELNDVMVRYNIPADLFLGLIKGCEMDIHTTRYETFEELSNYCYHVAGLVGLACMKIFGHESPTADQTAINLGIAFQLTNIIRDIKADLNLGRIYLAQEDLRHYGYSDDDFKNHVVNDSFFKLMHFYASRAESFYQVATQEFEKDKEGKLVAAKAMTQIYHALLKKIGRKNFPVFKRRVALNKMEKLWVTGPFLLKKKINGNQKLKALSSKP